MWGRGGGVGSVAHVIALISQQTSGTWYYDVTCKQGMNLLSHHLPSSHHCIVIKTWSNWQKFTVCRSICRIGWCRRGCGTCGAYQLLELGPDSREGNRRSHLPFHFQPALLPLHTFSFFFENFAMASGVKLSDGVKHAYDDIKKHSKYLYAIFIIKVYSVTCYASIKK